MKRKRQNSPREQTAGESQNSRRNANDAPIKSGRRRCPREEEEKERRLPPPGRSDLDADNDYDKSDHSDRLIAFVDTKCLSHTSDRPGGSEMEAGGEADAAAAAAAAAVAAGGQLVISDGDGNQQQLVLSAEDAAQLLAQAGIQLADNEQVIVGGDVGGQPGGQAGVAYLDPSQLVAGDQQQVRFQSAMKAD